MSKLIITPSYLWRKFILAKKLTQLLGKSEGNLDVGSMEFLSWLWGGKKLGDRLGCDCTSAHGRLGKSEWAAPRIVSYSTEASRKDQGNTIESTEYQDDDDVLLAKVDMIVSLIKQASFCTVYTGAGLSRTAGIEDYASKDTSIHSNIKPLGSPFNAQPTMAHRVLAALQKHGYLHHYVQQNHDGLPQKAGFPQEKMNEIHGAWYDPSNPVVQFSGKLRSDMFNWMKVVEKKTDLCLCLGTSLSGMNADRIAETPAYRSLEEEDIIGTVIINLQRTRLDDKSALRVWGSLDHIFELIAQKLELDMVPVVIDPPLSFNDQFPIPYNAAGLYDPNCTMIWDLRDNAAVVVTNPDACNFGQEGAIFAKDDQQNYIVHINYREHRLGKWWIQTIMNGKCPSHLPFVNISPIVRCSRVVEADERTEL